MNEFSEQNGFIRIDAIERLIIATIIGTVLAVGLPFLLDFMKPQQSPWFKHAGVIAAAVIIVLVLAFLVFVFLNRTGITSGSERKGTPEKCTDCDYAKQRRKKAEHWKKELLELLVRWENDKRDKKLALQILFETSYYNEEWDLIGAEEEMSDIFYSVFCELGGSKSDSAEFLLLCGELISAYCWWLGLEEGDGEACLKRFLEICPEGVPKQQLEGQGSYGRFLAEVIDEYAERRRSRFAATDPDSVLDQAYAACTRATERMEQNRSGRWHAGEDYSQP